MKVFLTLKIKNLYLFIALSLFKKVKFKDLI